MNKFLFIIPATPTYALNKDRLMLQNQCLEYLIKQTYSNWLALWVDHDEPPVLDSRILHVNISGKKEEKMQKVSDYVLNNCFEFDYVIRLDDDDIFNPNLLNRIKLEDFDVYTDYYQYFWSPFLGKISRKLWYWFPNSCIHKKEHAYTIWGSFATGGPFEKYRLNSYLIENDHSNFHHYYKGKKVLFTQRRNPVYLRTITSTSSTALQSDKYEDYLGSFGVWKKNFLNDYKELFLQFDSNKEYSQSLKQRLNHLKGDLIALKNYKKVVL